MGVHFTEVPINIAVTAMMIVMVIFLPLIDYIISRRHGVRLDDSLSDNPQADHYLKVRKIVLIGIFIAYLLAIAYVTFFSRSAANDYLIHISFYEDLNNSIKIDQGFLGFLKTFLTEGPSAAFSQVHIVNFDDLSQVYLNVAMFVPMGYLLPYVFDYFRRNMRLKVVITCFLASLIIENLQLITKLGFYDVDDIISNTLGGIIGCHLYIVFAYFLTHPNFRKEMKLRRIWRRKNHRKALFPYIGRTHIHRMTIFGSDKEKVREFYEDKLGLLLLNSTEFDKETYYLFEYHKFQIEIHCNESYTDLPPQNITIACNNSQNLKKDLQKDGIITSDFRNDPYTNLRSYDIEAPDNTTITIIEE